MFRVWELLDLLQATKANSLSSHVSSLEKMIQLIFSYDHHNSACSLPEDHTQSWNSTFQQLIAAQRLSYKKRWIIMNRSPVPGSMHAEDITIEQMINKYAKSKVEQFMSAKICLHTIVGASQRTVSSSST
jgi:hypothetical protein